MGKLAGSHFTDFSVRNCQNKRRFHSEEECAASIEKMKAPIPLKAYKCNLCGYWHKTKHLSEIK